jgi:SAM-dependent methyltransferase
VDRAFGESAAPTGIAGLRDVVVAFDAVGYRLESMRALLGITADLGIGPSDLAIHDRRLAANPGALSDLIAMFALGRGLPLTRAESALGVAALRSLIDAGALVETGATVSPAIRLLPNGGLWIGSDQPPSPGEPETALYVTGVHPPTTLLAGLTVRRPVAAGLDLGTGNGYQALLMAAHCDRVVATDVNPRALAFAEFNAALNGISGIEFREGGLFEPVVGERYDLIASNPPYVISPETELVYRDSGGEPGALCAQFVAEAPSHLSENGFATLLASWPIGRDEWSSVPSSWVGDDARAWIVQIGFADVLAHAAQWNRPLADAGHIAAFGAAVDRWVDYARGREIDRIGYGAVFLQGSRAGGGVIRADRLSAGRGNAGAQIERVFAADRMLRKLTNDAIAEVRCALPAEHRIRREIHNVGDGWRQVSTTLTLAEGLGVDITVDPVMAEVLLQMTSGMSVRDAVVVASQVAGVPDDERDDLLTAAVMSARELISLGVLTAR